MSGSSDNERARRISNELALTPRGHRLTMTSLGLIIPSALHNASVVVLSSQPLDVTAAILGLLALSSVLFPPAVNVAKCRNWDWGNFEEEK